MARPPLIDLVEAAGATPGNRVREIRRQLMERVADTDTSHVTVKFAGTPDGPAWRAFLPGVSILVLHRDRGTLSYLLRLEPGAALPAHRHPQDEECLVLEGHLRVGAGLDLDPGDYHFAHAGSLHGRTLSVTGATIFLRGAVPEADHVLR